MLKFLKGLCPPFLLESIKKYSGYVTKAQWEYMPLGFDSDIKTRGWNVQSVVNMYVGKWEGFKQSVKSEKPFGFNPAAPSDSANDVMAHNTMMSYAYTLLLAAQNKDKVSVLDWGGGIGHYGIVSLELLKPANPIELEYYCYDLPLYTEAGAKLNPQFNYFSDVNYIKNKQFDLVFVSSSLWYERDWKSMLRLLTASCADYLYITRLIFISKEDSFVAIQRPGKAGYETEYLCWIFNENEFADFVISLGFSLIKEIYLSHSFPIFKAPEQGSYKGFLFKRNG